MRRSKTRTTPWINSFSPTKLKIVCEMYDREMALGTRYKKSFSEYLEDWLKDNEHLAKLPIIEVYGQILRLQKNENADYESFAALKGLISKHDKSVEDGLVRHWYEYAMNFCIRKIRSGEINYQEDLLELNMNGIESKVLFEHEYLSPWIFKNVVKLGLRMSKWEWTRTFVDEHINFFGKTFSQRCISLQHGGYQISPERSG